MSRFLAVLVVLAVTLASCSAQDTEPSGDGNGSQSVARGEAVYEANCMRCHGGAEGGIISDMPPRHNAEGHTWHHADCDLLEIIADGLPDRPGLPDGVPTMPAFGDDLETEDKRAVLAFIKTWWTSDQRSFQQQVTEQVCNASS
ncbi:MAG: c-type cytochrome [Euzebya sp.]